MKNQKGFVKYANENKDKDIFHEPFKIKCHDEQWVHLYCSPYTLDHVLKLRSTQERTWFSCRGCLDQIIMVQMKLRY